MVFDNAKIKRLVPGYACRIPFSVGAEEIVSWHDADPARRRINDTVSATCERILAAMDGCRPKA